MAGQLSTMAAEKAAARRLLEMRRFYLVEREYVGPDRDSDNDIENHVFGIWSEPQCTNSSHQPLIEGWLGTTNDWSETAMGEFTTLEEARLSVDDQYPEQFWRDDEFEPGEDNPGLIDMLVPRPIEDIVMEFHAARAATARARIALHGAMKRLARDGVSEVQIAEQTGVTRMTVRKALGK